MTRRQCWEGRQSVCICHRLASEAASDFSGRTVAQEDGCGEGMQPRRSTCFHKMAEPSSFSHPRLSAPLTVLWQTGGPWPLNYLPFQSFKVFQCVRIQALHRPTCSPCGPSGRPVSRLWVIRKSCSLETRLREAQSGEAGILMVATSRACPPFF